MREGAVLRISWPTLTSCIMLQIVQASNELLDFTSTKGFIDSMDGGRLWTSTPHFVGHNASLEPLALASTRFWITQSFLDVPAAPFSWQCSSVGMSYARLVSSGYAAQPWIAWIIDGLGFLAVLGTWSGAGTGCHHSGIFPEFCYCLSIFEKDLSVL